MQLATGDIFCRTLNGPYLQGLSFLKGVLIFKLCTSNHTLSLGAKAFDGLIGLMHLYKAFCASDCGSFNIRSCFCTAGI